jgi:murein DD-endopeptidase MepM/ murein hydrolase activator NlpD
MNTSEKNKAKDGNKELPVPHIVAAGLLSVSMLALVLMPPTEVQAHRGDIEASPVISAEQPTTIQPLLQTQTEPMNPQLETGVETSAIEQAATVAPAVVDWKEYTVKKGDNLTLVFKRAGLSSKAMYELIGNCPEAKILNRIHPGHTLAFHTEDGKLQGLKYQKSALTIHTFSRNEQGFDAELIERQPEKRLQYRSAKLDNSLFLAGQKAGLSQNTIMQLANVFGGVIDFVLDPRKGDSFNILYEDLYLDGEKIGNGRILAAEYQNQGETFKAFHYQDSKGDSGYYAPDGVSMQKAFMRAPLDFTRVSSSFNLRRRHPIHKSIRAHRGIDYAAPRGTPVYAAGDGRVRTSAYGRANGNFIVIDHGTQYQTKYLHLTKRSVKSNQRVKKGQLIGTVGSTGYSTGPHLHYEFLVNGVHRNPRTILNKLPKAKSVPKAEMQRFKESIAELQLALNKHQSAFELALIDTGAYELVEPGKE